MLSISKSHTEEREAFFSLIICAACSGMIGSVRTNSKEQKYCSLELLNLTREKLQAPSSIMEFNFLYSE
jgi:hypothetical protein